MAEEQILTKLGEIEERLTEVVELSRQTLERIERTEDRVARASAELVRIGTLSGRPVQLERTDDASTTLFVGHIGVDIGNDVYVQLRALAFGAED